MVALTRSLSHFTIPRGTRGVRSQSTTLIVSGSGEVARAVIQEAAKRPDFDVHLLTSNLRHFGGKGPMQVSRQQRVDASYMEYLIRSVSAGTGRILFVNTIGSAHSKPGQTLEDVNEKPALAAAEGLAKVVKRGRKKATFINLSSRCATVGECNYSRLRAKVDQVLHGNSLCTITLRPDLVLMDPKKNKVIENTPYGPSQIAALPIHPFIGSGKQILQPLSAEDLALAIINSANREESAIIDAVGPEAIEWNAILRFFTELAGRPYAPIQIPVEIVDWLAKYAPIGRIAPYAIELLKKSDQPEYNRSLCHKAFEDLVGRPLQKMSEIYEKVPSGKLILVRPPIVEHCRLAMAQILKNPQARKEFIALTQQFGTKVVGDVIRAFLSRWGSL